MARAAAGAGARGGQPRDGRDVRRPGAAGVAAGGDQFDRGGLAHHFDAAAAVPLSFQRRGARAARGREPQFPQHGVVPRAGAAIGDTGGGGGVSTAGEDSD